MVLFALRSASKIKQEHKLFKLTGEAFAFRRTITGFTGFMTYHTAISFFIYELINGLVGAS